MVYIPHTTEINIQENVFLYIRAYIHMYVRTYIHTYVRTYIHTYIHGRSKKTVLPVLLYFV